MHISLYTMAIDSVLAYFQCLPDDITVSYSVSVSSS